MSNMSYCRFQNTLSDMRDCLEALGEMESISELSGEEHRAAARMADIAQELADELMALGANDHA